MRLKIVFPHIAIGCLLLLSGRALPQADTSLLLPAAEVLGQGLRDNFVGGQSERWDSAQISRYAGSNLPELLEREGGIFVKSYGLGSSATSSIRGGSASHTAVTWNGLPLQSPMLGQLDFSLLPLAFVDELSVQRGGQSAAWGSGAVSGAINLTTQPLGYEGLEASAQSLAGSFGLWDHQLRARYRSGRWAFNTRVLKRTAANDFEYELANGDTRRQPNAALAQQGILQELYWQPKPNQQLALYAWWQTAQRELPPTTVQNRSLASQADSTLRTALHWKRVGTSSVLHARLAWFRESIDYRDDLILLRALSHFHTLSGELENNWALPGGGTAQAGLFLNRASALADGYAGQRPVQQQQAVFGSLRQPLGAAVFQLSLRQGLLDGELLPIIPALGVEWAVAPWLQWQGKGSRSYRIPTLNDLYWQPGGRADLLPEQGWSAEGGFTLQAKVVGAHLRYSATAFNRLIDNWILWGIAEGQSFWSANNLTQVHSRGLEQRLRLALPLGTVGLTASAGYDYIRSTNEVDLQRPRIAAGEQLAYTPEHQGFAQAEASWQGLLLRYQHRWVGPVGTLNATALPGYALGHAHLQYHCQWKRLGAQLFLRVDNLWDASYRILDRRPMPGRSYQIGIHLFFKQPYASKT